LEFVYLEQMVPHQTDWFMFSPAAEFPPILCFYLVLSVCAVFANGGRDLAVVWTNGKQTSGGVSATPPGCGDSII
jgi:hypothetical protein